LCIKTLALKLLRNYYAKVIAKMGTEMAIFGYARVSTNGQTLASQDAQLMAAGCAKVYAEKVSGAKTDRPELAKLLRRLERGDVLVVTRLDRLARSTRDLLNILDVIAKAGAGFKSLGDAWADTTTPHGRLMLTVLGGLAEFERELILARTSDGRTRAKARGVKFGRPLSLTAHQRQEAMERLAKGEAQADIARSYAVSQSTISRLAPAPFADGAAAP
jgi:DNA invertase Pin-like site-specific DNA recombinase